MKQLLCEKKKQLTQKWVNIRSQTAAAKGCREVRSKLVIHKKNKLFADNVN